jgi:hypothetical protein
MSQDAVLRPVTVAHPNALGPRALGARRSLSLNGGRSRAEQMCACAQVLHAGVQGSGWGLGAHQINVGHVDDEHADQGKDCREPKEAEGKALEARAVIEIHVEPNVEAHRHCDDEEEAEEEAAHAHTHVSGHAGVRVLSLDTRKQRAKPLHPGP